MQAFRLALSLSSVHLCFLHILSCLKSSFLYITKDRPIVWMYHDLLIRLPIERHLVHFRILAVVSKPAVTIHVQVLCGWSVSTHLGKYWTEIVGSCDKSVFSFRRNYQTVFQTGCLDFAFPSAMNEHSSGSTPSPAFGVIRILNFSHSGRCVEVASSFLSFRFPMTYAGKD